jgi:hypothetical protein
MLSHKDKEQIFTDFPNIKLSYENITHNKVLNSDIILALPEGRKSFAWFTTHNNKNVCLIMELAENKQISNIKIINACFKNDLAYGTIFYGTTFYHQYNKFFTIEDIFYYKGNDISRHNWGQKFTLFKSILTKDIKQISLNNSFMVFGLPLLSNNLDDFTKRLKELKYKISTVQFRLFNRCNNSLFMNYTKFIEQKLLKPIGNDMNNSISKFINNPISKPRVEFTERPNEKIVVTNVTKREVIFKLKPDIQNDIYYLYCLNNNKEEYFDIALIPDFTTSVMMNKLFRKIKENYNLDALEESDDEEEFENEKEDRFVYLDKTYNMVCLFNNKFKKWYPVKIAEPNSEITNINKIKR